MFLKKRAKINQKFCLATCICKVNKMKENNVLLTKYKIIQGGEILFLAQLIEVERMGTNRNG